MTYRKSLASCLVILMCGCASKPTQQELERAEIRRALDKAYATDRAILRTCESLVTDLEGKPVDIAATVATRAVIVVAFVVLLPVIVAVAGGKGGAAIGPADLKGSSGGADSSDAFANARANALARDRITARCVVAIATEQRVGPDHAEMAVPLVRLGEAYQLASIDPKGPAAQQAQRLFERALSVVEKESDRVKADEEYGKQIEDALTSYISLLQRLKRDLRPICCLNGDLRPMCSRVQSVRASYVCQKLDDLQLRGPEVDKLVREHLDRSSCDSAGMLESAPVLEMKKAA